MDALLILTRFLSFVLPIGPERRPPAIAWRRVLVLYIISICAIIVVVVFYIARAQQLLVRMETLQIYRLLPLLFQSCLFFRLNVVTMLFLSAHCNSECCSKAAVCLQMLLQ